jgi:ABC-2 type transport system permease protein
VVAAILSAKLALLANDLRRRRSQLVVWVVASCLVIAMVIAGFAVADGTGPTGSTGLDDDFAAAAAGVLAGASLIVTWALGPVLMFGADSALTIEKLRGYPLRRWQVMAGLALSSVLGLPGLLSLGFVLGFAATWAGSGIGTAGVALLGGLLGLMIAVLAQRVVLDGLALVASTRRGTEIVGGIVLGGVLLAIPVLALLPRDVLSGALGSVQSGATIVAVTPVGAPWALASSVVVGDTSGLLVALAVSAGAIALLTLLWVALVGARMKPSSAPPRGTARRGLGFFGIVPDTVRGAITARTLTAWLRDPRYSQNLIFALALPLLGLALGALSGEYSPMIIYVVVSVLLVAASGSLDVSHDSTAFAATITSAVRGRDDRLGRLIAHAVITVPVALVALGIAALQLDPLVVLAFGGILFAVAAGALACSAVVSTLVVVPVAKNEEGPNASRSGAGAPSILVFAAATASALVVAAPSIVLTVVTSATGSPIAAGGSVLAAALLGGAALILGVRAGGRLLDRRATRLYASLLLNA